MVVETRTATTAETVVIEAAETVVSINGDKEGVETTTKSKDIPARHSVPHT